MKRKRTTETRTRVVCAVTLACVRVGVFLVILLLWMLTLMLLLMLLLMSPVASEECLTHDTVLGHEAYLQDDTGKLVRARSSHLRLIFDTRD